MNSLMKKWNKEALEKKKWTRILTNKMTIIAWRMFHGDRTTHLGFILLRMKKDFGFTDWELANFTGIPADSINKYVNKVKPILDSEILKNFAKLDWEETEHEWRSMKAGNRPQGYYVIRKNQPWYEPKHKKINGEPPFKVGGVTEKEYEQKFAKLTKKQKEALLKEAL